MFIFGYMAGVTCEYCGNKFDTRGLGRHRASCQKRKLKEETAAQNHNGKAVQSAKIRDIFEKVKTLETMLEDLSDQLVKMIKEIE
ncbi:MAG: hypothetical protein OIN86_17065 [Candidatus Methanoperedens sp.]|jgi:hypothetical protein|nr:hypothetical protein [Candidatus Methanoperedens sp.]